MSKETIELEDGKYTFVSDNGVMSCLRYGDSWRDMAGDKAVGALFYHAKELEEVVNRLVRYVPISGFYSVTLEEILKDAKELVREK